MRNLLYMFNQRSTKYVLPVFFIGTLFLSFSSTNIFCHPPSLLLTSSTIDNDNNNNYCNSNEFLVSATNIRSKNRRQATKQHGLIEPSVAYDMHVPYVAEPTCLTLAFANWIQRCPARRNLNAKSTSS